MNYRHSYHAGNFADVFKHSILVSLVQSFLRKNSPFCYLETHAGTGCYDLLADTSQKTREFENGIKKIVRANHPPLLIQDYLSCVMSLNPSGELRYYPGSPWLANFFMRTEDRLVLSELHAEDISILKQNMGHDKRIAIHHQDGYQSLKAFLPPKERRGLIFIDPPYEKNNECMELPDRLAHALKRFETGVYAVWYPIKTDQQNRLFQQLLKKTIQRPFLTAELCVHADDVAGQLNGSGMLIVNPPWQIDQQLQTILPWLWENLTMHGQGYARIN